MNTTIKKISKNVNHLIRNKNYSEALRYISTFDIKYLKREDKQFISLYFTEYAKCLYYVGEYNKSRIKIKVALKLSENSIYHIDYARQKRILGRILIELGEFELALEEFIESYAFFRRCGDFSGMLDSLDDLASLHFQKGDFLKSIDILKKEITHCNKYNFIDDILRIKLNLTRVYFFVGNFSAATSLLTSITTNIITIKNRKHNLQGIINAYSLKNKLAGSNLRKALKYYKSIGSVRDEVVCLEYLGLNEYFAGNYKKAKEYYDDILSRPEITASAKAQTLRMLTDVYIAEKDYKRAKEMAQAAEEAITKINERIELGALYRAYGMIEGQTGTSAAHDKAKDYFVKSKKLLTEIGARYELALTFFTCGKSDIYSKEDRKYYLRSARDLFIEMNVPKRVEQVDATLNHMVHEGVHHTRTRPLPPQNDNGSPVIITVNPAMKKLVNNARRAAHGEMTILLLGETGTGKDLLAEYIHHHSGRKGRFVPVNAAALPHEMIESELFGHVKGAFSGAIRDKVGLIESAKDGTFFLNEIAEVPYHLQAKVLDVFDHKKIRRVGDILPRPLDVRFIAATNCDLLKMTDNINFRLDLFTRLSEFKMVLPPLRDRLEDLTPLLRYFMLKKQVAEEIINNGLIEKIIKSFNNYYWLGNVRELENTVNQAIGLWDGNDSERLVEIFESFYLNKETNKSEQRRLLINVLKRNDGIKAHAARELGIPVTTLKSQLKRFNIS